VRLLWGIILWSAFFTQGWYVASLFGFVGGWLLGSLMEG
jgi:hypothetical protein